MLIDEPHHPVARRPSSAWAKYADALCRTSLVRFSSWFGAGECVVWEQNLLVYEREMDKRYQGKDEE